jgi:hypothetical protein
MTATSGRVSMKVDLDIWQIESGILESARRPPHETHLLSIGLVHVDGRSNRHRLGRRAVEGGGHSEGQAREERNEDLGGGLGAHDRTVDLGSCTLAAEGLRSA